MRKIIRSGVQTIEILSWHERETDDTVLEFRDVFLALNFLCKFMSNPINMMTLRDTLVEAFPYTDTSRLTNHEILQMLAWQIVRGYVKLVRIEEYQSLLIGAGPTDVAAEEAEDLPLTTPPTATPAAQEELNWIEFRLVDDETDQPISGVEFDVKLPTGEVNTYTTDANGVLRIDDLPSGTCDIEKILYEIGELVEIS